MYSDYIKIANYLDGLGKHKQADLVDNVIKKAQYGGFINYYQGTSPKQDLLSGIPGMFNPMAQAQMTSGFNPQLVSGNFTKSNLQERRLYMMTPQQIAEAKRNMSPEQFAQFMITQQVGLQERANTFQAGRSLMDLDNMMKIIKQTMSDPRLTSDSKEMIFKERFAEPVSSTVENLLQTENNLNAVGTKLQEIANSFTSQSVKNAIKVGVQTAIQRLDPTWNTNPAAIKKYNDIINHPFLKQFAN